MVGQRDQDVIFRLRTMVRLTTIVKDIYLETGASPNLMAITEVHGENVSRTPVDGVSKQCFFIH